VSRCFVNKLFLFFFESPVCSVNKFTGKSFGICYTDTMTPKETIEAFDKFLAGRGLQLDAVVIGGAALNLLGIVSRPTKDYDILVPALSPMVADAAKEFAVSMRALGETLPLDWLNNGPISLAPLLPPGWQGRLQPAFSGGVIVLRSLGRPDLLKSKLFAFCDRGTDLGDCIALAPTADELREALPWLEYQDANPDWPAHVRVSLNDLAGRLGYVL
jgi:hypothetical protein